MSNLDPRRGRTVTVEVRGRRVSRVSGRVLTAGAMNAHNTFEQPNVVRPESFSGARLSGERLTVALPPKSVVALELQ
jgi:alpha-N-arabinofuranosidase